MTELPKSDMSPALEAAHIRKLEAEARITDLSAEVLALEIENSSIKLMDARAELRITQAHALEAEYEAETARIATALNIRQEAVSLAGDHHHHVHHFVTPVDGKAVGACLTQLAVWHRTDPECDMNIVMNSPGGDAIAGLHLFDQLVSYSQRGGGQHKVTITVRGQAASMAGILLQAADVRLIGPESWLMIHEISAGTGGKVGEMKDDLKWFELMCDRIANVFVERSEGKITLFEFKAGWESHNWWLDSKAALGFGFVDGIA